MSRNVKTRLRRDVIAGDRKDRADRAFATTLNAWRGANATEAAASLAARHGLRPHQVTGTGEGGKITVEDVRKVTGV